MKTKTADKTNIKVAMIFSRRLNFLSVSLCMIEARRISLKMNYLGNDLN